MNESQRRAWEALGLGPVWRLRERARGPVAAPVPVPVEAALPREVPIAAQAVAVAAMDWAQLRAAVAGCRACALCETRTRAVFGVGPEHASWMVIGEAPGAEEDRRGEPFVGNAGRLLDQMLAALGLGRERDVFIANVLKCRPPNNRDPSPDEIRHCEPYLARQIELLSPRVIVVVGRIAAQALLRTEASIASLRGRVHRYPIGARTIPLVVTYHPAYLLRSPADKARAWADLCLARAAHDEAGG